MAKNIIDITPTNEVKLSNIAALLHLNNDKKNNNNDLINKCIELLYDGITASDEETCMALFNLKKTF